MKFINTLPLLIISSLMKGKLCPNELTAGLSWLFHYQDPTKLPESFHTDATFCVFHSPTCTSVCANMQTPETFIVHAAH